MLAVGINSRERKPLMEKNPMKRFFTTAVAASALFVALSTTATAQVTACSVFGKAERYNLFAYPLDGIPTLSHRMVSPGTTCVDGKAQYVIADTSKVLDTQDAAEDVINAIRILNRREFTDQADIAKLIKYVAEVDRADAARSKQPVAGKKSSGESFFAFGETKQSSKK